jgi:hypothetical protein
MVVFWKDSLDFGRIIQNRDALPTENNQPEVVGKQPKVANRAVKNVFLRDTKQI